MTDSVHWRAQVYKGLWNEVQDVAVKMVVGQSAEQQARFLREVRNAWPPKKPILLPFQEPT